MSRSAVHGIFVAADSGAPCEPVERVQALAGVGLEGDRYARGGGHLSGKEGGGRHVTLVSRDAVEAAELAPGQSRRNIETVGVDLVSLIGRRFRVGAAELVGIRECHPCGYLQKLTRPGLMDDLKGRGGLRAEILVGGEIAVGDLIEVVDD